MFFRQYLSFSEQELEAIGNEYKDSVRQWICRLFDPKTNFEFRLREYSSAKSALVFFNNTEKEATSGFNVNFESQNFCAHIKCVQLGWLKQWGVFESTGDKIKNMAADSEVSLLMKAVLEDFLENIFETGGPGKYDPYPSCEQLKIFGKLKGYGGLVLELSVVGIDILVIFDGALKKSISSGNIGGSNKEREELFSRRQACANMPVKIGLFLRKTSVGIKDLSRVGLGDVIQLDHVISEPLSFGMTADEVICDCYLGCVGSNKAISLI